MLKSIRKMFNKKSYYPYLSAVSGLLGLGSPVYSPLRYDAFSIFGYLENPFVYRCINLIAQSTASVPWKLYRKKRNNMDVEIERHPAITLLQRPNPHCGQADFFSYLISYLELSGNTYVKRVGPKNGPPKELYLLRPDRIDIENGDCNNECYDEYSWMYIYTCNTVKDRIHPRELWHGKLWNPLCDFFGVPPLQSALKSVAQLNASLDWNVSLLQNSANPSGVLTSDSNLSDEQISRLKEQMSTKYQGKWNAGRPLLLEGGLSWAQMSLSPHEAEWLAGMKLSSKMISIAYGVDPVLLGDADNRTYATFKDAEKSFWISTVLPLLDKLRDDFLNGWLLPLYPDHQNLYFDYDKDALEVLAEERSVVWDRAINGLKEGLITLNEARQAVGYGELEHAEEPPDETPPPEVPEDVDTEGKKKVLELKAINITTPAERREYHRQIEAMRKKWDSVVRVQVKKQFDKEKKAVLKAVEKSMPLTIESDAMDAVNSKQWEALYEAIYRSVMEDFGQRTIRSYKSYTDMEVKIDEEAPWMVAAAPFITATTEERSKEVQDTTKKRIAQVIEIVLAAGGGINEIEDGLNDLYDHDTPIRSRAISQTEVITAGNAGTRFAVQSLGGTVKKQWAAVMDDKTRESHRQIDGQTRGIDERYSNGLRFPGDPLGSAEETINCRCVEIYTI